VSLAPEIEAKVRASFARQSFMATLGAELLLVEEGRLTIAAPIAPGVLQQHGAAHAGLAFSLGDSAAGYSALTMIPGAGEVMTAEMRIHLLRPATGTRLVAEGRVVKPGRRLFVVESRVFAEDGDARREVAMLTGTMVPV
jgi:uncharacterized protein (TIGR00369 family)